VSHISPEPKVPGLSIRRLPRDQFERRNRRHTPNQLRIKLKSEDEAYEPMAIAEIEKICNRIREKWEVEHIAITHRLSNVPVCEASVVVAISSAHRRESLEAAQYAIDELKSFAPIWKKEVYEDMNENEEASKWKANAECFWANNGEKLLPK